jgi:protein-tyrosine phosphatase
MSYYKTKIINRAFNTLFPAMFTKVVKKKIKNLLSGSSSIQICFVCTGNICRSAFSERHLISLLSDSSPIKVISAGIATTDGKMADPDAIRNATQYDIDLTMHRTQRVTKDMTQSSTIILVMEPAQLLRLKSLYPDARNKTFLVSSLTNNSDRSWTVEDPYQKDDTFFLKTFHILSKCNQELLTLITTSD